MRYQVKRQDGSIVYADLLADSRTGDLVAIKYDGEKDIEWTSINNVNHQRDQDWNKS